MKIRSIELENFRQYKGKQKLRFSTDSQRNVTVVMGENGAGKTTLEQAFLWCLYGKAGFANQEVINREVRDTDLKQRSCQVSVTLELEHEGKAYRVRRLQYHYLGGNIVSRFEVCLQGVNGDWSKPLNDTAAFAHIKSILPEDLSQFFFFDGERIDRMSKELTQKRNSRSFKDAVHGLVGMKPIYNAIQHFGSRNRKSTVIGKFNQEISADVDVTVQSLESEINSLERDLQSLEETYRSAEDSRSQYEQVIGQVTQQLRDMQGDINRRQQYDKLRASAIEVDKHILEDKKQVFLFFARHCEAFLLKPLLEPALAELKDADELDKGVPHIQADTIRCLLERHRCLCGAPLEDDEEKVRHLLALIPSLPPNSIGQMVGRFAREARQYVKHSDGFMDELTKYIRRLHSDEQEVVRIQDNMQMLEGALAEKGKVEELQRRRKEAERQCELYRSKARQASSQLSMKKERKQAVEAKRLRILSQDVRNRKNLEYLRYAEDVAERLRDAYEQKEGETRTELEAAINRIFEAIYDGGIELHVSDDYTVRTTVTDTFGGTQGDDLEQNTAQSYAIIFAFISSIIELAKRPDELFSENAQNVTKESYPLVMDAPLSSFDKTRIARICGALPQIAEQVIIFIKDTDGETAEQYLSDRIGSKWQLVPHNKTYTTIEGRE